MAVFLGLPCDRIRKKSQFPEEHTNKTEMISMGAKMVRICFVCLGNICRSPTAEGVMLHLVSEANLEESIFVDSAGTSGFHSGEKADRRSRETANNRGFELPSRSRKFISEDFARFDYIIAMDKDNMRNILALAGSEKDREKVQLFRDFDPDSPKGSEVPDPYYGGSKGFEQVFDICFAACEGLLSHIRNQKDI